eukprot:jgi/Chlat1/5335/Chrsp35S05267
MVAAATAAAAAAVPRCAAASLQPSRPLRAAGRSLQQRQTGLPSPLLLLPAWPRRRRLSSSSTSRAPGHAARAQQLSAPSTAAAVVEFLGAPTWLSAATVTALVFTVGSPLLLRYLTPNGYANAFFLGLIVWRAFGGTGFAILCIYFLVGSRVTKLKMEQKEREGIAEKQSGRRSAGGVWGSGAAGAFCGLCSVLGVGGAAVSGLWSLGFLASICTKLSDTVSSEVGKAYGQTTYLVTTLAKVPRGTEGAVSVEGTAAGAFASAMLAVIGQYYGLVDGTGVALCITAAFVANYLESLIGATLQEKPGWEWLTNDLVNILNISIGATVAIASKALLLPAA